MGNSREQTLDRENKKSKTQKRLNSQRACDTFEWIVEKTTDKVALIGT